jgi:endonuclease YncB( thermonuclease family)
VESNQRVGRKFRKLSRCRVVIGVCLVAFVGFRSARLASLYRDRFRSSELPPGAYTIVDVIDGFEFVLADDSDRGGRTHRVRLLGVSPIDQTNAGLSRQACDFSRQIAQRQCQAVLRLDRRRYDRDGTSLGHLYVDGRLVSCDLVRAGLARLDTRPGDSAEIGRLLRKAEEEARRARLGIWQGT